MTKIAHFMPGNVSFALFRIAINILFATFLFCTTSFAFFSPGMIFRIISFWFWLYLRYLVPGRLADISLAMSEPDHSTCTVKVAAIFRPCGQHVHPFVLLLIEVVDRNGIVSEFLSDRRRERGSRNPHTWTPSRRGKSPRPSRAVSA